MFSAPANWGQSAFQCSKGMPCATSSSVVGQSRTRAATSTPSDTSLGVSYPRVARSSMLSRSSVNAWSDSVSANAPASAARFIAIAVGMPTFQPAMARPSVASGSADAASPADA